MKLETFIDKLHSVGFIQNERGAQNWYENYADGASIFVGIIASEIGPLGNIPITICYYREGDEEETEKDYMTTDGAWMAIKRIIG